MGMSLSLSLSLSHLVLPLSLSLLPTAVSLFSLSFLWLLPTTTNKSFATPQLRERAVEICADRRAPESVDQYLLHLYGGESLILLRLRWRLIGSHLGVFVHGPVRTGPVSMFS